MDIQIKIKNAIDNNIFPLIIKQNDNIDNIKEKIQDQIGIDKRSIRLIYKGYPLLENESINKYNIDNDSIINLIRQIY
jgi:hypothetical protein